jgi:putative transposase
VFAGPERLTFLEEMLLRLAIEHEWSLEAWAVFPNHYHFVGHAGTPASLRTLIRRLHASSARWANERDATPGRKVWHNFWDTQLTFENSYLARLNYVHQNPVGHGLVRAANQYPWCSAAWFERTATPAQVKTIYGIQIDQVRVPDEF